MAVLRCQGESHVINITGPSVVHCGPVGVKLRETQRDVDCGDQKVEHFIFMWTQWIIYMGTHAFSYHALHMHMADVASCILYV